MVKSDRYPHNLDQLSLFDYFYFRTLLDLLEVFIDSSLFLQES